MKSFICKRCKNKFSGYGDRKFCTYICYKKYKKTHHNKYSNCPKCKKEFLSNISSKKLYCSKKCYKLDVPRRKEICSKAGKAYVANKQARPWTTYRKRALDKYGPGCSTCGDIPKDIRDSVVHHKDGRNYPGGNHTIENLVVMCRSCHNKLAPQHHKMMGDRLVEKDVANMLLHLKLDVEDPNLKDTPRRIATLYDHMFSGLKSENKPDFTVFPNTKPKYDQIILVRADFMSMCSHHFMPFYGEAYFGYVPDKHIVGLSKIRRVLQYFAHRPQLQERLTQQTIELLHKKLKPKGSMLVTYAKHMCIIVKDPSQKDSQTVTSAIKGCFNTPAIRNEFLQLVAAQQK